MTGIHVFNLYFFNAAFLSMRCLSKTKNPYRTQTFEQLSVKFFWTECQNVDQMRHFSDWMYHVAGEGRRDILI